MGMTGDHRGASFLPGLLLPRAADSAPEFLQAVSKSDLHIFSYPLPFAGDICFPDPRPVYLVQERVERVAWRRGGVFLLFHMELIAPFPPNPAHVSIGTPILVIPQPNLGSLIPSIDLHDFSQVPAIRGTNPIWESGLKATSWGIIALSGGFEHIL